MRAVSHILSAIIVTALALSIAYLALYPYFMNFMAARGRRGELAITDIGLYATSPTSMVLRLTVANVGNLPARDIEVLLDGESLGNVFGVDELPPGASASAQAHVTGVPALGSKRYRVEVRAEFEGSSRVALATASCIGGLEGAWLLGWRYRRPVTIDNSAGGELADYQVRVELNSANFDFSKAKPDGSDVRLTDSDGLTLLPYWVEVWDAAAQRAVVWVKVPEIPAGGAKTIYMYYGNPNAADAGDPAQVFIFFDDMEVWEGWTQYGSGVVSQDGARAYEGSYSAHKTSYNDPNGAYKAIGTTIGRDVVLECRINRNSRYTGGPVDRVGLIDDSGNGYGFLYDHSSDVVGIDKRENYRVYPVLATARGPDKVDYWYFARLVVASDGTIIAEYYDAGGNLLGRATANNSAWKSFTRVYIFGGHDYWVDLVWIRKYASSEPAVAVGSEQAL